MFQEGENGAELEEMLALCMFEEFRGRPVRGELEFYVLGFCPVNIGHFYFARAAAVIFNYVRI